MDDKKQELTATARLNVYLSCLAAVSQLGRLPPELGLPVMERIQAEAEDVLVEAQARAILSEALGPNWDGG